MKTREQHKVTHRIKIQRVEVQFDNPEDAFNTREELSGICRNRLIPAIEKLFDRKYAKGPLISIPSLVIDAGMLDTTNWQSGLIDAVLRRMEQFFDKEGAGQPDGRQSGENPHISQTSKNTKGSRNYGKPDVENGEHRRSASFILYYLKHGVQPWNASYENKAQLKSDLLQLLKASHRYLKSINFAEAPVPWGNRGRKGVDYRDDFTRELLALLTSDLNAMKRLLYLVPEKHLSPVLIPKSWDKKELRKIRKNWNAIFQLAGLPEAAHGPVFLQALGLLQERREKRSLSLSENISGEVVRVLEIWHKPIFNKLPEVLEKYLDLLPGSGPLAHSRAEENPKEVQGIPSRRTTSLEEPVYITNAGLVLLHPFLHHLFANAGHTINNQWDSLLMRQRSVVLTQYLVTGEDEYAEHELFLNKLLTGFPSEAPLPLDTVLSDFEKKEAGDLLESAITHWKALQNTGIPALRETFLLRQGKLSRREGGWLLEVDQQVPDILISKIPWGLSTIKTGWMQDMLTVEWA